MQINIISVSQQTIPTTKGSYQALEVTFKDTTGKVAAKKIMSFVKESKKAFDTLATASNGDVFDIKMVKDAQDKYWVWTDATRGNANAQSQSSATTGVSSSAGTVSKGNWETAEERAKKQIYIIRQSSLSTAVQALVAGAKAPPKQEDILALAKTFESYVFDGLAEEKSFAAATAELEDDLFQDLPQ